MAFCDSVMFSTMEVFEDTDVFENILPLRYTLVVGGEVMLPAYMVAVKPFQAVEGPIHELVNSKVALPPGRPALEFAAQPEG